MTDPKSAAARAACLTCWSGPVEPEPIAGGITNTNFLVRDRGERHFVRVGDDIPVHGVLRFNEEAAARAAALAGIAPAVIHSEPGVLVSRFVEGRTLTARAVREPAMLERIVPLIGRCHRDIPRVLRGPILMFWVFHVLRDYAASLREDGSRFVPQLGALLARADELEEAIGPIDVVFGHNDLLAANFIDDGKRLWLVDWEYAGFNSPLFDLGGLASNSELTSEREYWLLERYFARRPDAAQKRSYRAMKCASLLRESMWSMVSEMHSRLDVDFIAYTQENLARFERAYEELAGGS